MKKSFYLVTLTLIVSFSSNLSGQRKTWNDPNSLPQWMTEEEESRRHEIKVGSQRSTPAPGNLRGIAEFERMEGVLVRYPLGISTSLIKDFATHTKVYTLVATASAETSARSSYQSAGVNLNNCVFVRAATDSYWTRDYGPWYVMSETDGVSILDFTYNRPRPNDNAVNSVLATFLGVPRYTLPLVHTGGNYMTDGRGISASTDLVYTENGNNVSLINQRMNEYSGISTYHVTIDPLGDYIKHIDCWGKYLSPDKVLITRVPASNSQYSQYEQVANYFANAISSYGTPYRIYRIDASSGQPYSNSLILNDRVYVPVTGNTATDNAALNVYRSAMPGYTVVGFTGSWQSTDALHCRTMGMADRQMLDIKHQPYVGTKSFENSYTVNAKIKSNSGTNLRTDSLIVFYSLNNGSYQSILMSNSGGNDYSASIPVSPTTTEVDYYIYAVDNSGRREKHPFIGAPDPHTFTITPPSTVPNFTVDNSNPAVNQIVTFTSTTSGTVTTWNWNFGAGANPSTATTAGPHQVSYSTTGLKTVSLTVNSNLTETKTNFINVRIPVTGISVSPTSVNLTSGQTQQLTASISPYNATNQNITWSSSNTAVASVNQSGLVTAVGSGSTIITATSQDGGFTGQSTVNVTIPVTGITLSPGSASIQTGSTIQLIANVSPSNATNKSVVWSSDNNSIASVSSTGLVSGNARGSTIIRCTTVDGSFLSTSTINVTNTCTPTTILSDGFQSSFGNWVSGGSNCYRSSSNSYLDPISVVIRSSGTSASMRTNSLNLTSYNQVTFSFSYITSGFTSSTQYFQLQMSTNGGSTYTAVSTFTFGSTFNNRERKNPSISITGPFTTTTRFRLRCYASTTSNLVYIDNVVISGCQVPAATSSIITTNLIGNTNRTEQSIDNNNLKISDFEIFPNPNVGRFTIKKTKNTVETYHISVYNVLGEKIKEYYNIDLSGGMEFQLEDKVKPGLYILKISNNHITVTSNILRQ